LLRLWADFSYVLGMKTAKLSKRKVKILRPNGKRETYWKVITPRQGGGSSRRFFKEESEANTFMDQQQTQLANYGTAGANLDEKLRGRAIAADEILKPHGLDLLDAAKHYRDFVLSQRGGLPLADAVDRFKRSRGIIPEGEQPKRKTGEAKPLDKSPYSPIYRKALSHRLKRFLEAFPDKTTRQVTSSDIDAFLSDCGGIESVKGFRNTIKAFYNFMIEEGQCEKNPVRKGKTDEVAYSVEILSPEQCAKLLHACNSDTLPSVAIAMFAGLRSSEIERLNWNRVTLNESVIILDSAVARKTGSRRVVPIHPTLAKWLQPYAKQEGAVQPGDFRKQFDRARVIAGFKPSFSKRKDDELQGLLKAAKEQREKLTPWPSNSLRHTAISYAMADCRDHSKIASWAGNSPSVIKRHYDAQATPSAAVKFYAIIPDTSEKVIDISKAA
jgi:integrase